MPIDCDAIVVSDLHLGRPGKARPKVVRRFFEEIAAGTLGWRPKKVILNGDTVEDLDLRKWPRSHWQALAAIRLVERSTPVVWVRGNHDGPFEAVEFMAGHPRLAEPVGVAVTSGGRRFMVAHGKREAVMGSDPRYAARSGVTNREAIAKLRDQWANYDRHGLREAVAVARGAVAYARGERFDWAVCGHTHGPFDGALGGFPYTNGGSWTKGNPATFVLIRDGRAALMRYEHKARR